MKVCLLTCEGQRDGTHDDFFLAQALKKLKHEVRFEVWTSPYVDWTVYDQIIIRSPWDYQYRASQFRNWVLDVSSKSKVLNSAEIVDWNFQKDYLLDLQVPVVPTYIFSEVSEIQSQFGELHKKYSKLVIKPTISASAEMTFLINKGSLEPEKIEPILSRSKLMVQPFISSIQEDGEISLIYFNDNGKPTFSHAVLKKPKASDFRVQSKFGGSVGPAKPSKECLSLGIESLSNLPGVWAYARVDIVDWKKAPKIGELEMIEPELFFRFHPESADQFAQCLQNF